jgi:dnd system-associated protein 4
MSSALDQRSLFSYDHTIYWPSKYERVVEFLKHGTDGKLSNKSLYKLNVEVIVLAACIGLRENNAIELPANSERKEIALSTFNEHQLGIYIYIIPLLGEEKGNVELFRNKNGEDIAIAIFQKYAAGGLEILNDRLNTSGHDSPYLFLEDLISSTNGGVIDVQLEIQ